MRLTLFLIPVIFFVALAGCSGQKRLVAEQGNQIDSLNAVVGVLRSDLIAARGQLRQTNIRNSEENPDMLKERIKELEQEQVSMTLLRQKVSNLEDSLTYYREAMAGGSVAGSSNPVTPPADNTPDVVTNPPSGGTGDVIVMSRGGFTWIVGSAATRSAAESQVLVIRNQGFTAGVITSVSNGQTRYRIGIGQLGTLAEARAYKGDLPAGTPGDAWIYSIKN